MFEKVSVMEPEKLSCEKKHLYTKPSKPNDAIDRMKNERAAVGLWWESGKLSIPHAKLHWK